MRVLIVSRKGVDGMSSSSVCQMCVSGCLCVFQCECVQYRSCVVC